MNQSFPQYNLPREKFPFTIISMRADNGEEVDRTVVDLPNDGPRTMHIAPLAKQYGVPIKIRIEFADGEIQEEEP